MLEPMFYVICCTKGRCAEQDIRPKLILNPNLMNSRLSITFFGSYPIVSKFAQSTAVILPCSVQNFKTIEQLKQMLWTNEISWDDSLRWVSDGYPILHNTPGLEYISFFVLRFLWCCLSCSARLHGNTPPLVADTHWQHDVPRRPAIACELMTSLTPQYAGNCLGEVRCGVKQ